MDLLFADATSTSKGTKADESISITLPNTGAAMKAGICIAHWSLAERACEECQANYDDSSISRIPVNPGAQSQNHAVPLGSWLHTPPLWQGCSLQMAESHSMMSWPVTASPNRSTWQDILLDGNPPTSLSPRVRLRMHPRRPGAGTTISESLHTFLRVDIVGVST